MERVLDVTIARRQFGTILDEVFYKGDVVTIERKGKPLARIVPIEENPTEESPEQISAKQKELIEELYSLPTFSMLEDPTEVLRKMRKDKRIQANRKYGK